MAHHGSNRPAVGLRWVAWLVAAALVVVVAGGVAYYSRHPRRMLSPAAPPGATPGGTVTVLGVWGGSELESFRAMIGPFERATGVRVQFEGTRDINAVLTTRARGGNPPDIAGLPGPEQMAGFAKDGQLVPLDDIVDLAAMRQQYAPGWLDLARVDGKLYGIFIKAALKGLIWYDPKVFGAAGYGVPKSWDDLVALTDRVARERKTPWCIGLESGAATGWPATDWIENIMLRTAGPDVYAKWYRHQIAWTDPAVRRAWDLFGRIAAAPRNVYGGIQGELATNFGEAPFPLFAHPPGCYLHHQATFVQDFIQKQYPNLKPAIDFNFFLFPRIDPGVPPSVEVAGDLFGMFRDTPQARALMRYLATPAAQAIWVKRGGALSPNRRVDLQQYPDPVGRRAAEIMTAAPTVRFDASDLMPDPVASAFMKATLDYVQHPSQLDRILADLDRVATDAAKR